MLPRVSAIAAAMLARHEPSRDSDRDGNRARVGDGIALAIAPEHVSPRSTCHPGARVTQEHVTPRVSAIAAARLARHEPSRDIVYRDA